MLSKRTVAVVIWLLVTLTSAFGFMASELEIAPGDFFCETLDCAGGNNPETRNPCRENGWLNYDTLSGYSVGPNKAAGATNKGDKGGLNLFKWGKETTTTPNGWKQGDRMLHLPDKGSPRANWKQNSGRLRQEMRKNEPIFDSYRNPTTGEQIPTDGFLNAERQLLESRGWQYNPSTGAYHPPGG